MASDYSGIDRSLTRGMFTPVGEIQPYQIPEGPGLYCIKVTSPNAIPKKFGEVRSDGIIYIGQASMSLHKRLWEEELNHKRPATFFRSIGAVLGYLPPESSLAGKNTRNYKFSAMDTLSIQKWMQQNLAVSFNVLDPAILDDCEEYLIKKYAPLINIEHNPSPSEALRKARQRCVDVAKGNAGSKTAGTTRYRSTQAPKPATKPIKEESMPESKPWYKNSNNWAWIVTGVGVLGLIILMILISIDDKRAQSRPKDNRTWYDIMTPEERHKMGLDRQMEGAGDWTPPADVKERARKFIENGGNADPALDAIQDGDYHDLLDQNGGPAGF